MQEPIFAGLDRGTTAAGRRHLGEVTLVVHVHDGLDLEHAADECGGGRNTAAALKEIEVVYREPMDEAHLVSLEPFCGFLDGLTRALLQHGVVNEKTLTERRTKAVYRETRSSLRMDSNTDRALSGRSIIYDSTSVRVLLDSMAVQEIAQRTIIPIENSLFMGCKIYCNIRNFIV